MKFSNNKLDHHFDRLSSDGKKELIQRCILAMMLWLRLSRDEAEEKVLRKADKRTPDLVAKAAALRLIRVHKQVFGESRTLQGAAERVVLQIILNILGENGENDSRYLGDQPSSDDLSCAKNEAKNWLPSKLLNKHFARLTLDGYRDITRQCLLELTRWAKIENETMRKQIVDDFNHRNVRLAAIRALNHFIRLHAETFKEKSSLEQAEKRALTLLFNAINTHGERQDYFVGEKFKAKKSSITATYHPDRNKEEPWIVKGKDSVIGSFKTLGDVENYLRDELNLKLLVNWRSPVDHFHHKASACNDHSAPVRATSRPRP